MTGKDYLKNSVVLAPSYWKKSADDISRISLGEALDWIKDGTWQALVKPIRATKDKEKRDRQKKNIPSLCLHGDFDELTVTKNDAGKAVKKVEDKLKKHSGVVVVDADLTGNVEGDRDVLINNPHVLSVGLSVSGRGLFAVVPVYPVPRSGKEHRHAFSEVCRVLGAPVDGNQKGVGRLRGASYDPDLYINPDCTPVQVDYSSVQPIPRKQRRASVPGKAAEDVRQILARIYWRPPEPEWMRIISGVLEKMGGDIDAAEKLLIEWRPEEEYEGEYRDYMDRAYSAVSFASVVHYSNVARFGDMSDPIDHRVAKQLTHDAIAQFDQAALEVKAKQEMQTGRALQRVSNGVPVPASSSFSTDVRRDVDLNAGGDGYSGGVPDLEEEDKGKYNLTDLGNAERLIRDHGDDLKYCAAFKSWLVFDGQRWQIDDQHLVDRKVMRTVRRMQRDAVKGEDNEETKKLFNWGKGSESNKRRKDMLQWAQSMAPVRAEELDCNDWLLNVENGTLDLKTGRLLQHSRKHLVTKLAPVTYDAAATSPRFIRFLNEVFIDHAGNPDDELILYIQRLLGYCLTGSTAEQSIYFCYGQGANGKDTLLSLVQDIIGEYAGEARTELIMRAKKQANAASEDEASLQGRRLVKTSETDSGRALGEATVKRLTGTKRITARRNYGHNFEFVATHKIFLLTNHKPEIQDTTHSIWRRVHLIPFNATFTPGSDPTLESDLRKESAGVLNWLLEGCLMWQKEGLKPPKAITEATEAYRTEMDKVQRFIDECCTVFGDGITGRVGATKLWEAFQDWCRTGNENPETQRKFGMALKEKGFEKKRGTGGATQYKGIAINAEENETAVF